MKTFQSKYNKLAGIKWSEAYKKAMTFYDPIKRKTKRRPYVRSAYFNKQKIFLDYYWRHLHEKNNLRDKARRVRFFPAAIDLIKHNMYDPATKDNINKKSEILNRFIGKTKDGHHFYVQIKQDKKSGQKHLFSTFPKPK
jgi:hypothetical protein